MAFDWYVQWTKTSDRNNPVQIMDCITANISKSTEIKNNLCNLTFRNSLTQFRSGSVSAADVIGTYVDPATGLLQFGEEDEFRVWAAYLNDATEVGTSWYDDDRLIGAFSLEEFNLVTDEQQQRVTIKAVDIAYLLFNKIYTFSYGVGNVFTAPGIIRDCARKFGEATTNTVTTFAGTHNDPGVSYAVDSRFVSEGGYIEDYRRIRNDAGVYVPNATTTLNGSLASGDTTINVVSTSGFDSAEDGTLVIDTEHISYTGVTATSFTGCTRGIDSTVATSHSSGTMTYQGFPLILMSKIWKPLFEWIGELSQTENTNYLSEVQEGGTQYFNRAFIFWVDKNNAPHWVYPDDTVDVTIDLGEEGRRAFSLQKAVFDAINFIIYNAGEDMYGNGITYYLFDETTKVATLKMRYQPMTKIVHTLLDQDLITNSLRDTTNQDLYKQFPASYPVIPSFLDDANKFRASQGSSARTNVASNVEYNDCLREAAKQRGLAEAQKIVTKRTGLRYRGTVTLKGAHKNPGETGLITHVNPGDLISTTEPPVGLSSQLLRVISVNHVINANSFESTLTLEEDERVTA